MRKFILTLFRYLILLVSCLVFIIIIKFLINYNFYYDTNRKSIATFSETKIGIFGHSHSERGLDDLLMSDLTSLKVRNFSKSGFPLFNSVVLAKKLLENSPNSTLIFCFTNNNIGEKGTVRYLFSESYYQNNLKNMLHYYSLNEMEIFFNYDPLLYAASMLRSITYYQPLTLGYQKLDRFGLRNQLNSPLGERIVIYRNNTFDINLELTTLEGFIKENPKNRILLVRMPMYLTELPNEKEFQSAVQKLVKYNNASFIDYLKADLTTNDFGDISHLNTVGAQKFTKLFVSENLQKLN